MATPPSRPPWDKTFEKSFGKRATEFHIHSAHSEGSGNRPCKDTSDLWRFTVWVK